MRYEMLVISGIFDRDSWLYGMWTTLMAFRVGMLSLQISANSYQFHDLFS